MEVEPLLIYHQAALILNLAQNTTSYFKELAEVAYTFQIILRISGYTHLRHTEATKLAEKSLSSQWLSESLCPSLFATMQVIDHNRN